jgi:hypothetical protein
MKLITSIHKLPLSTFIDCICDNDYEGLIIEGNPTESEIIFVWNDLLEQYSDALQDDGQKRYILAYKEYQQAKIRYDLANTHIELLNNYFKQGVVVKPWIIELNKLVDASYVFNEAKIDEFEKYLNACFKRNKGNLIRYNLATTKLEELSKIQGKGSQKPDRSYFTKVMINLKNQNSREIPYDISTYEFCVLVNQYKKYVEYLDNPKTKGNGRS